MSSGLVRWLKRNPWARSQLRFRRNCCCSQVSTPSATVSIRSDRAMAMIADTIGASSRAERISLTNERSIFSRSTGKRLSRPSIE